MSNESKTSWAGCWFRLLPARKLTGTNSTEERCKYSRSDKFFPGEMKGHFVIARAIEGRLFLRGRSVELQAMMLTIVDVNDRVHPQIIGAVAVDAYNMASYEEYLYIATLRDGVLVFRMVPN